MAEDKGKYRFALGEMQVLADVRRTDNLVLRQNDIWLYTDTSATLTAAYRRIANVTEEAPLRFFTDDPAIRAALRPAALAIPWFTPMTART